MARFRINLLAVILASSYALSLAYSAPSGSEQARRLLKLRKLKQNWEEGAVSIVPYSQNFYEIPATIKDAPYDPNAEHEFSITPERYSFYDPEAIYVGNTSPGEAKKGAPQYHFWMVAGRTRLEPGVMPPDKDEVKAGEISILDYRERLIHFSAQGVIFKLKLPERVRSGIEQSILARRGGACFTCLHPVVEILQENGIQIGVASHSDSAVNGAQMGLALLEGNLFLEGAPIPMELVTPTSRNYLATFLRMSVSIDRLIVRDCPRIARAIEENPNLSCLEIVALLNKADP